MQKRLNELGYNCGKADGIFGANTESAVKKFQKAKGLGVDGIVGHKTIAALYNKNQPSNDKDTSPSNDKDTSPKPSTPPKPKPSTDSKIPITSTLRRGSRGSQVVALQKRLNELGYNCGKADGIFGANTESAVKKFQKAKGLSVDGIVGQKTIAALFPVSKPDSEPIPNNSYKRFYGKAGALKDKIVVIDPGHGGKDPGASRKKINEKDIVLDISLRLERMLKEAGATVIMTRDKDVFEELSYRSAIANKEMLKTEIKKLGSAIDELDSQIATLDAELEQEKTALEEEKTALEQKKKEFEGYINVLDKNPNQIPQDVKKVLFELADTEYRENMVFVSIHVNSTEATSQTGASGIRIYYTASNEHNEQSRVEFAQTLLNELKKSTDFSKTSSKPIEANLAVLRGHNFVSALVEAGFINNPNDLQKLVEAQTREDIATGIYNGIVAHFNKK